MAEDINLPISSPRLNPGEPAAVEQECTCDPVKNRYGEGATAKVPGKTIYYPDSDCPIHGLEAMAELVGESLPESETRMMAKRDPRERTIVSNGRRYYWYAGPFKDVIDAHDYLAAMQVRGAISQAQADWATIIDNSIFLRLPE
jgi:hypothetical protein